MTTTTDDLLQRIQALKLYGLENNWEEIKQTDWIKQIIIWEEQARSQRSLERRLRQARTGKFKSLADFDWSWPKQCDRGAIEAREASHSEIDIATNELSQISAFDTTSKVGVQ